MREDRKLVLFLLGVIGIFTSVIVFGHTASAGGASVGTGSYTSSGGSGNNKFYCFSETYKSYYKAQALSCPHYILTSIADFKKASKNALGGSSNYSSVKDCTDTSKNKSGMVVWVGREASVKVSGSSLISNSISLTLHNPDSSLARYKQVTTFGECPAKCSKEDCPCVTFNGKSYYKNYGSYGNGNASEANHTVSHYRDSFIGKYTYGSSASENHAHAEATNFWNKTIPNFTYDGNNKVTWFQLLQIAVKESGMKNDADLAFFCPGMFEEEETTTAFTSESAISINSSIPQLSSSTTPIVRLSNQTMAYDATEPISITFYHKISRTNEPTISSAATKYIVGNNISGNPATGTSLTLASGASSDNLGLTTITVSPGSVTSSDTTGNSLTLAEGDSIDVCRYIQFAPTIVTSTDVNGTGNGYSGACVTIVRQTAPVTNGTATFAGSVSITEANSAAGISCSGTTCTASQSGTYTFNRVYLVTRTDSNSAAPATRVRFADAGGNYSNISGASPLSEAISYNSSNKTIAVKTEQVNVTVAKGGANQTVCGFLSFDQSVSYSSQRGVATETGRDPGGRAYQCITVIAPADSASATFSGSVSITEANSAAGISCNGTTCTVTQPGTYTFNRVYTITRTDSNGMAPATQARYSTSGSSYPAIGGSSPASTAIAHNSPNKTATVKMEQTSVTVTSGGVNQTICGYLSFDQAVNYSTAQGVTTETGRDSGGRAFQCVTIIAPSGSSSATFAGSVAIAEANSSSGISCNGSTCTASQPGTYTFNRVYRVTRTDSNSAAPATQVRYAVSGASYPTITDSSPRSSAIAHNSPNKTLSVHTDQVSVTVTRGGADQTICGYLSFDQAVSYKTESGSTSETGRDSGGRAYSCVTITAPVSLEQAYFSGNVTIVDGSGSLSGSASSGFTGNGTTTSYSLTLYYQIRRIDTDAPDTGTSRYVYSRSSQPSSYSGGLSTSIAKGNTSWQNVKVETVTVNVPAGSSSTVCGYLSYDNTVTYANGSIQNRNFNGRSHSCTTITNPAPPAIKTGCDLKSNEYITRYSYQYIQVSGYSIPTASGMISNASSYRYETKDMNVSVIFDHQFARTSDGLPDVVSLRYNVAKRTSPTGTSSGGFAGTSLSLSSGQTWSTASNYPAGKTTTAYFGSELKAGQTATVSHIANFTPYMWRVQYAEIWRWEWRVYTTWNDIIETNDEGEDVVVGRTPEYHYYTVDLYDRTDRCSATPEVIGNNDTSRTSSVYVTRPYNYKVAEIDPVDNGSTPTLTFADDSYNPTFNIQVEKDDPRKEYISDMENPTVAVIGFVVNGDITQQQAENRGILDGGTAPNSNAQALCNSRTGYYNFADSCTIYKENDTVERYNSNNIYSISNYEIRYAVSGLTVPHVAVGQKFCVAIGIKSQSSSSSNWRLSKPSCATVAKKPTIQVWGGNVYARGGINTSQTRLNNLYFGSWGDFALISGGLIRRMGSGASYAGGRADIDACEYSPLTIANRNCKARGQLGNAIYQGNSSTILERVKSALLSSASTMTGAGSTVNREDLPIHYDMVNARFQVPSSGYGGSVTLGSQVFYSKRNIEITKDIIVNQTSGSYPDYIVIVAEGNVIIDEDVERIDAWIVAGGNINTCSIKGDTRLSPGVEGYNSDVCNKQLSINGPVVAKTISLNRSAGGDALTILDPAERIDFNAMYYIWAFNQARRGSQPQTVYLRQLAPRY